MSFLRGKICNKILHYIFQFEKDTVTAHILLDFDKSNFKLVDPVSQISSGGIVKLWGWLKIETQGNIEPQTYYLEWEYKRKLDRADDYYWVSKRVWVQEKGSYVFRVYIKENKEFKIIKQTSISIKE